MQDKVVATTADGRARAPALATVLGLDVCLLFINGRACTEVACLSLALQPAIGTSAVLGAQATLKRIREEAEAEEQSRKSERLAGLQAELAKANAKGPLTADQQRIEADKIRKVL